MALGQFHGSRQYIIVMRQLLIRVSYIYIYSNSQDGYGKNQTVGKRARSGPCNSGITLLALRDQKICWVYCNVSEESWRSFVVVRAPLCVDFAPRARLSFVVPSGHVPLNGNTPHQIHGFLQ